MKVSGHGGYWIRKVSDTTGKVVHNAEYEVLAEEEVREHRSAGCRGWTEGLPKFRRLRSLVLKVAEDDEFYPQALGFTEGQEVTVYLKRGALEEYDLAEAAQVESVRVLNDNTKARRVEVVCKHGRYTRQVELPEFLSLTPTPPGG